MDQLKTAATHGRILGDQVFEAILHKAGDLQTKFDKLAPSLADASNALENNIGGAIGRLDKAIGASKFLVKLLNYTSQSVEAAANPGAAREAQVASLAPADKARFYLSEQQQAATDQARLNDLMGRRGSTNLLVTAPVASVVDPQIDALRQQLAVRQDNLRVLKETGAVEALTAPHQLDTVRVTFDEAAAKRAEEARRKEEAAARKALETLEQQLSALDRIIKARDDATEKSIHASTLEREAADRSAGTDESRMQKLREAQKLRAEVAAMPAPPEQYTSTRAPLSALPDLKLSPFAQDALAKYDAATAAIARQKDQFGEAAVKLRAYRDDLLKLSTVAFLRGNGPLFTPEEAVTPYATARTDARGRFQAAGTAAYGFTPAVTGVPAVSAADIAKAFPTNELRGFQLTAFKAAGVLDTLHLAASAATDALRDAPAGLRDFFGGLTKALGAIDTIGGVVANPGKLRAQNPNGSLDLIGTVGNVAGTVGAVASIVSTVGSVFGSLFGHRAPDPVLAANTQAVDKLRLSMDTYTKTAGAISDASKALSVVKTDARNGQTLNTASGAAASVKGGFANGADLEAALKAAGSAITFKQLEALGRSYGLELFSSKGQVLPGTLDDFRQALALAATQATQFGTTLSSQQARLDLKTQLFSPTTAGTPAQGVTNELTLLDQLAPALGKTFAGLSPNTEAGRAAILKGLQDLFTRIDTKQLTVTDLGGLANLDELTGIIKATSDGLTSLGTAANDVTAALLNVPTGFKVAQARFDAQDAQAAGGGASGPAAGVPGVTGPIAWPSLPSPIPGATTPTGGMLGGTVYDLSGLTVVQAAGETPGQALDKAIAAKKRTAVARGLAPSQWATIA